MIVGAWIGILALLTVWFGGWFERQANPNQDPRALLLEGGTRELVLAQNRAGHYVATGAINGQDATFLLDTGATDVSVPGGLARRLGLRAGSPRQARTANGVVTVYDTRLAEVDLGGIRLRDVRASVNPHMGGEEVLLGMSFLRHLELVQRGRELTLRQRAGP
jgi:aspartyl protease family protein